MSSKMTTPPALTKEKIPFDLKNFLLNNAIYIVLVLLLIAIIMVNPQFLSITNFNFILSQASTRVIIALGVAGIIVLGGTDLSAGRAVGLAGIISASLLQSTDYTLRIFADLPALPLIMPLLLGIVFCMIFSMLHAAMVAKFKIAPFIASLGFQLVLYGVQSIYFDAMNFGSPIGGLDRRYSNFVQGAFHLGGVRVPYIVIYATIVSIVIWFIWNHTSLGQNMYAVGGNKESAMISGVNISLVTIIIYIIAGALYGFAGFLEAGRTGSATNSLGFGYELDAIAACVVGGVSLQGGIGKVGGVITGVLIFQVINYGLNFIGVNPYAQSLVKGAIILFAITIDTQKYIKKR